MKHQKLAQTQNPAAAGSLRPVLAAGQYTDPADFTPSPDEVARKAYFAYVNQGSRDGHEVQHWLAAEQELIAERNQTRVHGFHNRS
jgi:hypothetical protein